MIYLAQPYSHPDLSVRYIRYQQGMAAAALLLAKGEHVYAPIVSWHEAACQYPLPKEFEFWRRFNLDMISRVDRLALLLLEGWQTSVGMLAEVEYAISLLLPLESIIITPNQTLFRTTVHPETNILGEFTCGKDNSQ